MTHEQQNKGTPIEQERRALVSPETTPFSQAGTCGVRREFARVRKRSCFESPQSCINKMDMEDHSMPVMPDSDMLRDMIREEILDGEDSDQVPEGIQPESYENNEEQEEEEMKETDEENMRKRPPSATPSDDEPASKKRTNEVDKLWKNVNDNPNDFQAWTLLLQHIDQVVSFVYVPNL
ncbi:pre-mRNA-processing factor 39-like [Penaeus indicus]|uniref:pre-mRNA-processing factor 39-like n=1 Tax=Penaeus indicus TaxID=29960 RepID=UPI00300D948F